MAASPLSCIIGAAQAGQRVDKALLMLFPSTSTRERKSLWQKWTFTLNGRKAAAGDVVCVADVLCATPKEHVHPPCEQPSMALEPRLLQETEHWLFFFKPRALHTAKVSGGAPSLESFLAQKKDIYGELFLCNRLDAQTSGIVAAARSAQGVQLWQDMEDRGLCQKRYVALVHGQCFKARVRAALDTDKRKISRVLEQEAPALRHTYFFPLQSVDAKAYAALRPHFSAFAPYDGEELHLVGCTIYKGARHQIRAHAAHVGFPLWGDVRYVTRQVPDEECFLLHHGALFYEHGAVHCVAPWQGVLADAGTRIAEFFG